MTSEGSNRPPAPPGLSAATEERGSAAREGGASKAVVSGGSGGRPPGLAWPDLAGATVGLWGLGREGAASLRKLRSLGVEPVLVDDNPPDESQHGAPVLATAGPGLAALARCEVVIKTPGISRYSREAGELRAAGACLVGGLGLWLAEVASRSALDRVVAVTGTKGKSTTSSVLGHLLAGLGQRTLVGGNIGVAPYDPLVAAAGPVPQYWVIEVSSYQATDLPVSPPVVAVTSLHPDHLPWHGGVEQYYRDKLSACSQPGAALTIANGDSDLLRERFPLLGPRVEWVSEGDDPHATWMDALGLPGGHNRRNALIARACLRALGIAGADDDEAMRKAAIGYQGLPSRLATIGSVDGVTFVDDSLSTNVLPTLAALDAFPGQRVALIVGGQDRGIDYADLAAGVAGRDAPTLVLTLPDSGPRISAEFGAAGGAPRSPRFAGVTDCPDLPSAVAAGFSWARGGGGGVVLLSPAAPSFGHFRDYRDRAEAFAAAMGACASAPGAEARPSRAAT